jgi:hypothetical protein
VFIFLREKGAAQRREKGGEEKGSGHETRRGATGEERGKGGFSWEGGNHAEARTARRREGERGVYVARCLVRS